MADRTRGTTRGEEWLIERLIAVQDEREHCKAEVERLREGIRKHREAWKREAAGVPASRFDRMLWALLDDKGGV